MTQPARRPRNARATRPHPSRAGRAAGLVLALLALALSACAPMAEGLRGALDSGDATLNYLEEGGGVIFDPGAAPAYRVVLQLRGEGIQSEDPRCTPEGERYLDCRLGTVTTPQIIYATGTGILGGANYGRDPAGFDMRWAYTPIQ